MTRFLLFLCCLACTFGLTACGDDHDHAKRDNDAPGHADDADEGDHDDHSHEDARDIGTKDAGPAKVNLTLYGDVKAGFEAVMDVRVENMKPEAVRAWVGIASGEGSIRAKLDERDGGEFHGHVDVPTKLPEGSAVWIELEAPDGTRHRTSFEGPLS